MIDSHAHLTSPKIGAQVDILLERALQAGVKKIVNICTDAKSLASGLVLQQSYPWIFTAAATTPHDIAKDTYAPILSE